MIGLRLPTKKGSYRFILKKAGYLECRTIMFGRINRTEMRKTLDQS
jgi:hypothetical protein